MNKRIYFLSIVLFLLICFSFLLTPVTALGATYYVSTSGSDNNAGTASAPWRTIQKAANMVNPGDTVLVRGGTYSGRVLITRSGTASAWITFKNYSGEKPVIDGSGISFSGYMSGLVDIMKVSYLTFDGFEVRDSVHGGICVHQSHDVTIKNNHTLYTYSNGIRSDNSDLLTDPVPYNIIIDNNWVQYSRQGPDQEAISICRTSYFKITNNKVDSTNPYIGIDMKQACFDGEVAYNEIYTGSSGNIYIDSGSNFSTHDIDIHHNYIHAAGSESVGIKIGSEKGGATVKNIKVYNNIITAGLYAYKYADVETSPYTGTFDNISFINNIIKGGNAGLRLYVTPTGYANYYTNMTIRNNVFIGNNAISLRNQPTGELAIDHNFFTGTSDVYGASYLTGDPKFVSATDYHLQSTSPCIDKGSSVGAPSIDYYGVSRPQGTGYDIGATEYPSGGGTTNHAPVLTSPGNKSVNEGSLLQFTVTASDQDGGTLNYSASGLPSGASFTPSTRAFSWTPSNTQSGTYSNVCFKVTDSTSLSDTECIIITVIESPSVTLVYPSDRWQRIWYTHSTGALLGSTPDQTSAIFDNNWSSGVITYSKSDNIEFRSSRTINILTAGSYTFTVGADDGVRLWIDDVLKIDKWINQAYTTYTVTLNLTAGNHKLRLDYYEDGGNARVSFNYNAQTVVTGATYYVATNGSDSNAGTLSAPWRTIQKAADMVNPGDTVIVRPGTYNEIVIIKKSGTASNWITFKSETKWGAIVNGERKVPNASGASYTGGTFMTLDSEYILIDGFKVINSYHNGIASCRSNYITIQNCYTQNSGQSGIRACYDDTYPVPTSQRVHDIKILGNTIDNALDGSVSKSQETISCVMVTNLDVMYNKLLSNNRYEGICIKTDCINTRVAYNDIATQGVNIYVGGAPNNQGKDWYVYNNYVHGSGVGLGISLEHAYVGPNTYFYNNIVNVSGAGFAFYEGAECNNGPVNLRFINNVFKTGGYGIRFNPAVSRNKATSAIVRNNIFSGSGIQLNSNQPSSEIIVDHNFFTGSSDLKGTDYLTGDPKFVSATDYHLQSTSPAINKGSSLNAPTTDYDGKARPQGAGFDIGAFEYGTGTITIEPCINCGLMIPIVNPVFPQDNQSFTITCPKNASGYDCINASANGINCTYSGYSGNDTIFKCSGLASGTYTAKCQSVTGTASNCCVSEKTVSFTVGDLSIVFVSPTDPDNAVVYRNWTEIKTLTTSSSGITSFINWNKSLLGRWGFNENTGTITEDDSTYLNNGNLINSPKWTTGVGGSALSFNGYNDRVEIANTSLNLASDLTLEAWVNISSGNTGAIIKKWSWVDYSGFHFDVNNKLLTINLGCGDKTSVYVRKDFTTYYDKWTHVAATVDNTAKKVKLYINGSLVSESAITKNLDLTNTAKLQFGGFSGWSGKDYTGNIEEVRIWNRALSDGEIKSSYDAKTNPLSRKFENLAYGTYQYYAQVMDNSGKSVKTETRTLALKKLTDMSEASFSKALEGTILADLEVKIAEIIDLINQLQAQLFIPKN